MSESKRQEALGKLRMTEIRNIFNTFFHNESTGGILLLVCAVFAVLATNIESLSAFDNFWERPAGVSVGDFSIGMSIRHWVNDGLMAVFFFVVGLEIKREILVGELSSFRHASLPVFAAIGGMVTPALIYALFNSSVPESASGWGISMATDIAFAIGIISLLGKRVPLSLKIFLTALAIVDDLGAIIVLALFYPSHDLHLIYLLYAAATMAGLAFMNFINFRNKYVYVIAGIILWYFVYRSGVHATIAGVLLAIVTPAKSVINELRFGTKLQYLLDKFKISGNAEIQVIANPEQQHIIHSMHKMVEKVDPLMHRFESKLHPWVTYFIMPVFALANAGVLLNFDAFAQADGLPAVSKGIFFGLLLGKPIGIFTFSWLTIKIGMAQKPSGTNWSQLLAVGILGGIGFTMSIFINNLAFSDPGTIALGKITILFTSVCSALIGLMTLYISTKKNDNLTK